MQVLAFLLIVSTVIATELLKFLDNSIRYIELILQSASDRDVLVSHLYVPLKLLRFLVKDGTDLIAQCFAVLVGGIILDVQPSGHNISFMYRVLLALLVLSYYWFLLYSIKLIK